MYYAKGMPSLDGIANARKLIAEAETRTRERMHNPANFASLIRFTCSAKSESLVAQVISKRLEGRRKAAPRVLHVCATSNER